MGFTTSGSPTTAQSQSTNPELRLFQLGAEGAGAADSVNMFRGSVGFPLTLLSLVNRGGLRTDLTLRYDSDVAQSVDTRNQESPTGIVGLGWSLPYEMILLDVRAAGSPYADAYYLATSDGGRSRLWPMSRSGQGTPQEIWTFELETFRFQQITYSPPNQTWTILEPDGNRRIYGAGAVRYAVKWGGAAGNWTGPSNQTQGQQQFAIGWNLSQVVNSWGDVLTFSYSNFADDLVPVSGSGGLCYTRASYLVSIADPSGRTVSFSYRDKCYDKTAGPDGRTIREYEPPHSFGTNTLPFQDRYETRYLDSITLSQTTASATSLVTMLRFAYSLDNLSDPATPGDPVYLYKRYLRAITAISASGKIMPGQAFDYYSGDEVQPGPVNRGALKTITSPAGGVITYQYARQPMTGSARDLTISQSDPSWISGQVRIFPGPDSMVVVGYQAALNQMTVNVFDWNGRWLSSQPIQSVLPFTPDLQTLNVVFGADFFVVSVSGPAANGVVQAWAANRVYGRYGFWTATPLATPPVGAPGSYQFVAGPNFIVAAMAGESQISRWVWDPRAKSWIASIVFVATGDQGEWVLTASNLFFALCQYQPSQALILSVFNLDPATLLWNDQQGTPALQLDAIQTYVWSSSYAKLTLSASETFLTATFITILDPDSQLFSYSANAYTWDANFQATLPVQSVIGANLPFSATLPVLTSVATPTLMGNANNLLRFDGVEWQQGSLGDFEVGGETAAFVYAGDLAVGVSDSQEIIGAFDPASGQFVTITAQTGALGPDRPTASDVFITVRGVVYERQAEGTVVSLGPLLGDAVAVANQGPSYIAYGQSDGSSYVLPVKNGVVGPTPMGVTTGSVFVLPGQQQAGPGLSLVGPQAFVSFVGASLDSPLSLSFHRVLDRQIDGPVQDFVVSGVVEDDGLGQPVQAAFDYSRGQGTVGPYGLVSQYDTIVAIAGGSSTTNAPFGFTQRHFYNGLARDGQDPSFLYSSASGLLWKTDVFSSSGTLVSAKRSTYEIVTSIVDAASGNARALVGAYARFSQVDDTTIDVTPMSTSAQPPLVTTTWLTYNEANGQPRGRRMQNYSGAAGAAHDFQDAYVYAYEIYPSLAAVDVNILTRTVQTTTSSDGEITGVGAETWKPWGGSRPWAPFRSFRALAADAAMRPSDWNNTTLPDAANWRLQRVIRARDATGEISESREADGLIRSNLTGADGRLIVAGCQGASIGAGQIAYLGFEPYENMEGWTLAGDPGAFARALTPGDASSGAYCLLMGGATTPQSSPLARTLQLAEPNGQAYVLSCWVKTGPGFGPAQGQATLSVTAPGGVTATAPVPDTHDGWLPLSVLVEIAAASSPQAVVLSVANTTNAALKVDDLKFSPVLAHWRSSAYDRQLLYETSSMDSSGALSFGVSGEFGETQAAVGPDLSATRITAGYLCRRRGSGFSATMPNTIVDLRPRGWAFHQRFDVGGVPDTWVSSPAGAWTTCGGALRNAGGAAVSISFGNYPVVPTPAFGAALRVRPAAGLTAPAGVGLKFGGSLALTWSPMTATWTLSDGTSTLAAAPFGSVLQVPAATYGGLLDQGVLPDAFLTLFPLQGLPLAPGSQVRVVAAGAAYQITDAASSAAYHLVVGSVAPGQIDVALFPQDWVLLVVGETVTFFADGGAVLSHGCGHPVAPSFAVFATDAIAVDNAHFFTNPGVNLRHLDGLSRMRQLSTTDGTTATASATLYDPIGRAAIATLAANVPASSAWSDYLPSLAAVDWVSGVMTGLVATDHPEAHGYPYSRTRFENSPIGRRVEVGLPGASYAIGAPNSGTARYSYGLNDSTFPLAAGKFRRITSITADGFTTVDVSDVRGRPVATAQQTSTPPAPAAWVCAYSSYDAADRLITTTTPMGWGSSFTYDFLGQQQTATRPNDGTVRSIFDSHNRLRFQLDDTGASTVPPYIKYWKYDKLSRVLEQGTYVVTPDVVANWPASLAGQADQPAYPPANPATNFTYDFLAAAAGQVSLISMGQVVQTVNAAQAGHSGDPGNVAAEQVTHDVSGRVVRHALSLDGGATENVTLYGYDTQGGLIATDYPTGLRVERGTDLMGRVVSVTAGGRACASYTYRLNGQLASEVLFGDDGQPIVPARTFDQAPPGWESQNHGTGFGEHTSYAPSAPGNPGYFGGEPFEVARAGDAGRPPVTARYALDSQGRLGSVQYVETGGPPVSFTYDDNGNTLQVDASINGYTAAGKDRVQSSSGPSGAMSYAYDLNGRMTGALHSTDPTKNLSLSWDPSRNRPGHLAIGPSSAPTTLDFLYGSGMHRVRKIVTPPTGSATTKLYLRGAGPDTLVERIDASTVIEYVRGVQGVIQIRRNGTPYYVATDRLGSIRAVLDGHGGLVAAYDYTPYGAFLGNPTGSDPAVTPYGFLGRELDESGLHDFRARLYDSSLARFISPDRQRQFVSPYIYAGDSPLTMSDPDGEIAFLLGLLIAALVGAVIGAAGSGIAYAVTYEGDFSGAEFGRAIGIGAAAGFAGGAAGFAAGAAATAAAVALGQAANSVAVGVAAGAVAGAAGGAIAQLSANGLSGQDPGVGMAQSVVIGAVVGGIMGGAAARYQNRGNAEGFDLLPQDEGGIEFVAPVADAPPPAGGVVPPVAGRAGARDYGLRARFQGVRNASGGRVFLAARPSDGDDAVAIARQEHRLGRRVIVLSGTHGDQEGGFDWDRSFAGEDRAALHAGPNALPDVEIYNVRTVIRRGELAGLVNSDASVVCAWCYSDVNDAVLAVLRRA